jgi:5'-methylthioadenosine phosphorylase
MGTERERKMTKTVLGIIGGSGLYEIDGLENIRWEKASTPWGEPSDDLLHGTYEGTALVFLPRHGRDHRLSPTAINYRANIDAMKRAGVTDIISMSAVGSFKEEMAPGTFVMIDQFIDRTHDRKKTFFERGLIAHVSMAHPVCPRLQQLAFQAGEAAGVTCHMGGTYLAMEGPQFSSYAESKLYQSWGCSVIGMTNMPEAKLAREAEIPYTTVAMVTDYDCWHPDHDHVEVATLIGFVNQNADNGRALIKALVPMLGQTRAPSPLGIETCLDTAIINGHLAGNPEEIGALDAIMARYLSVNI